MEMKMSCVCLVLGLVLLMTVSADADSGGVYGHPDNCCFRFVTFAIPDRDILKVAKIDSRCPNPGYIVTTPRAKFCKKDLKKIYI